MGFSVVCLYACNNTTWSKVDFEPIVARLLWNSKVNCRVYKSLLLVLIKIQMNQCHVFRLILF